MYVLPVRKGGLGNQLFQVAAAMVYSIETDRQVIVPLEQPQIHTTGLEYCDTVFKEFPRIDRVIDGTAIEQMKAAGFSVYPGEPGFEPWSVSVRPLSDTILLHGYFQYYPPIGKYEEYIREKYLSGLLFTPVDCVGIHVRRGDFLKPPHSEVHYIQTETYYRAALEKCKGVEFKIFSDDLEWNKLPDSSKLIFAQALLSAHEELKKIPAEAGTKTS